MSKRLNIEFIREEFAKEGYILLIKVYKNNYTKLEYICPRGHRHSVSWNKWQFGRRCPYCVGNAKLNIEFIRLEFAKEGYILLTEVYNNSEQKLEYICPKGHKHSISWSNWKLGKRCPHCMGVIKPTIEHIRAEFAKEGYILLTTVYENNQQRLDYICSRGHEHRVCWSAWNSSEKIRCPYCYGNAKLNIESIRAEFAKEGYTLLTRVYENSKQKLDYICPNGHTHNTKWNNWKSGYRCPYCVGNAKLNIEFIRSEFAKENYTLLTKVYKNAFQKLEYVCPKGHLHSITWTHWQQGQRCPEYSSNISKWEKTVKNFLAKSNIDYVPNDRTQLLNPITNCNFELDIWFPDLNKAIECNGVYWHSKPDRKECDKIKKQLCENQNIDLLVITDEEWNQDTEKCKAKLIKFVEIGI